MCKTCINKADECLSCYYPKELEGASCVCMDEFDERNCNINLICG